MPNNGTQTITVTATDLAGNTSSISEPVLIDLAAPDIGVNVNDGAGWARSRATCFR